MLYPLYNNPMTTITGTAASQPWWTRNNVTYAAVYYARTLAKIWRALSEVDPADNARTISY